MFYSISNSHVYYLLNMGNKEKKRQSSRRLVLLIILVLIVSAVVYYVINRDNEEVLPRDASGSVITPQPELPEPPAKKGVLKTFTAEQFRDLYNNYAWPNTQRIGSNQPITNNSDADAQIRIIAERRGYRLSTAPVSNTFVNVEKDMFLQQRAAESWTNLKKAAEQDSIFLTLTDGYRSADDQKAIFLSRLDQQGIQISRIASGSENSKLDQLMTITAPPSYSRHHNGYTVDIACDNQPGGMFETSTCFDWISAENYKNAKTHGWIPSYPEGAQGQGPEPEAWEYVWVGVDTLIE